MKKTFTFKYAPNIEPVGNRLIAAAKSRRPHVRPDELNCKDLKTLLQIATPSRLELFETILREKPSSLYELSEKLGKNQSYVLKEAKTLATLGLIELVPEKDGARERLRPVARYSKIVISCGFEEEKEAV